MVCAVDALLKPWPTLLDFLSQLEIIVTAEFRRGDAVINFFFYNHTETLGDQRRQRDDSKETKSSLTAVSRGLRVCILSLWVVWPLMDLPLKAPRAVFMEISVGRWLIILSDAMHFYGRAPITRTGMPFSTEIYFLFRHSVTVSGEYRLALCEHSLSSQNTLLYSYFKQQTRAAHILPAAWGIYFALGFLGISLFCSVVYCQCQNNLQYFHAVHSNVVICNVKQHRSTSIFIITVMIKIYRWYKRFCLKLVLFFWKFYSNLKENVSRTAMIHDH